MTRLGSPRPLVTRPRPGSRQRSARALHDAFLHGMIARVHAENYAAYGAAKVWDHLNAVEGVRVARCTTERLMRQMRQMGLQGVRRGRQALRATIGGVTAAATPAVIQQPEPIPSPG